MMISPKIFPSQLQRKLLIPQVRPGWSPQCSSDVMSLSELPLLSEGTDRGQRRDLDDKCRSCLGPLNSGITSASRSRVCSDLKH